MTDGKNGKDYIKNFSKRHVSPSSNNKTKNIYNDEKYDTKKIYRKYRYKILDREDNFSDSDVIDEMLFFLKHENAEKAARMLDKKEIVNVSDNEVELNGSKSKIFDDLKSLNVQHKCSPTQEGIDGDLLDNNVKLEEQNYKDCSDLNMKGANVNNKNNGFNKTEGQNCNLKRSKRGRQPQPVSKCHNCQKNGPVRTQFLKGSMVDLCRSCFKTMQETNCAKCQQYFTGQTYIDRLNNTRICKACYRRMKKAEYKVKCKKCKLKKKSTGAEIEVDVLFCNCDEELKNTQKQCIVCKKALDGEVFRDEKNKKQVCANCFKPDNEKKGIKCLVCEKEIVVSKTEMDKRDRLFCDKCVKENML